MLYLIDQILFCMVFRFFGNGDFGTFWPCLGFWAPKKKQIFLLHYLAIPVFLSVFSIILYRGTWTKST